ncbi:2-hydroxy-3-keto-5-methylthiopentenyl-1-phosphate phosphatase [Bacillus coahuilensis]|uniref:2-hydroxy-3-keto-5-methylthiopentenyl-1- phosphate phosphatase n=1 Tax=Bacillus coahuilensis TaxID=408580 RepID=UPI0001850B73
MAIMTRRRPLHIYCDFDGTITMNDNIIELMNTYAPKEAKTIIQQILTKDVPIQDGVGRLFSFLPSSRQKEFRQHLVSTATIRPGFEELIGYCQTEEIPLTIVSGGIDFFIYPILAGFVSIDDIYCNEADFSHEKIRIIWPYTCDSACQNECGCCKPSIIRKIGQSYEKVIMIGDSVTDIEAAKLADLTLSCGKVLSDECQSLGLPYKDFHSFHEVIHILEKEWIPI